MKQFEEELKDALTSHLAETGQQVTRLERVFEPIDKKAVARKCEAMEGIIKEAASLLKDTLNEEKAADKKLTEVAFSSIYS